MADRHALVVEQATVRFAGHLALDRVDLSVRHGEVVALVGPNGAGKTTLLDVVSGHVPAGTVYVDGRDATRMGAVRRARLGLGRTYQDGQLFSELTVVECLQLGLARDRPVGLLGHLLGAPWSRAAEKELRRAAVQVAARFGLTTWVDVPVGALSTGTRRAVDLAMHTTGSVRLLVLDEPTAGLARPEVAGLVRLLRRVVADTGCAVLVAEHDAAFLAEAADRYYFLQGGRVVKQGSPVGKEAAGWP